MSRLTEVRGTYSRSVADFSIADFVTVLARRLEKKNWTTATRPNGVDFWWQFLGQRKLPGSVDVVESGGTVDVSYRVRVGWGFLLGPLLAALIVIGGSAINGIDPMLRLFILAAGLVMTVSSVGGHFYVRGYVLQIVRHCLDVLSRSHGT